MANEAGRGSNDYSAKDKKTTTKMPLNIEKFFRWRCINGTLPNHTTFFLYTFNPFSCFPYTNEAECESIIDLRSYKLDYGPKLSGSCNPVLQQGRVVTVAMFVKLCLTLRTSNDICTEMRHIAQLNQTMKRKTPDPKLSQQWLCKPMVEIYRRFGGICLHIQHRRANSRNSNESESCL
jgi:hypothetical protein